VNALDSTGKSALMHAVEARQPKTVETLVQLGADPHVKGKDGVSAIDVAKRIGDQRILSMLE
jgi:ankyrin repeat protein